MSDKKMNYPKAPSLISEEEARDKLLGIFVKTLEIGLQTGAMLPDYVKGEAENFEKNYPHALEETKKRLAALKKGEVYTPTATESV